jgi:hypothetical protein
MIFNAPSQRTVGSYGFIIDVTDNTHGNVPEQRGRVGGTADER